MKINIGSGHKKFNGWINIDQDSKVAPELLMDVTKEFNYPENSLDFVYNEHFIEHISFEDATNLCSKIYTSLKPGGVLRIATPDLDYLCEKYLNNWKDQDWLQNRPEISNRCLMLNNVFYNWGHRFLYNEQQLSNLFVNCKFTIFTRCEFGQSNYEELRNLETRLDSKLIMEAKKDLKKWLI